MINIHHQYIGFVRTRLLQRFKLRHQHLGFKEMAFARFQAAFNHIKIAFQVDEREIRITFTQQVAIVFFQCRTDDQRYFIGALHSKRGVVQRLQPRFAIVVIQRFARRHFFDIAARMEEIAIKKRGMKLMRHFTGDRRFAAARYAHQDVNVVIMVSRAQSGAPTIQELKMLRVTVIGNIVQPDNIRSNIHPCLKCISVSYFKFVGLNRSAR
ncbi:Hypothetical protein c4226 [Escherichia coli CFT073]|uniref:Uncharacterized protein n=1 Tax=Escherichia coli O6:H1 (strain CFT073 / ATCC 700928 / UPEC) TaxID=199310 RepID=A0A0H2VBM5_ECOL6|nr:Hypothetical protein c4226 [Escherichia coli CFT073]